MRVGEISFAKKYIPYQCLGGYGLCYFLIDIENLVNRFLQDTIFFVKNEYKTPKS